MRGHPLSYGVSGVDGQSLGRHLVDAERSSDAMLGRIDQEVVQLPIQQEQSLVISMWTLRVEDEAVRCLGFKGEFVRRATT